ncbi:hypothetical protein GF373_16350, partial [bacterium]|nr:hypothetical protein [bacterium]
MNNRVKTRLRILFQKMAFKSSLLMIAVCIFFHTAVSSDIESYQNATVASNPIQPPQSNSGKHLITVTCMPLLDWCKQIAPVDAAIRLIPPCVTRIQTVKTIQNTVLHICFGTQPMGLREIDLSRYRNKVPERLVCYNWEKKDRSYWMDASNPNTAEKQQILDIAPRVFSPNMAYKWLDPIWAQETIRRVADRFKALWPRDADRIEQKTQDYLFDIFQLHLKIAETINPFPQKSFVDTNSRLQSLAERYGIQ